MSGACPLEGRVHVVGAGLAGLAAAVDLAEEGCQVTLYEAGRMPAAAAARLSMRSSGFASITATT